MTSPTGVLQAFLDRSNDLTDERCDQFASNAVLEWFGRTIRGQHRIQQFLRYDVQAQFEQNFSRSTAAACDAFETKPTHLQTRSSPPENHCDPLAIGVGSNTQNVNVTPLDRIRFEAPPTPGAPSQGRIFKRSPSIETAVVTVHSQSPSLDDTDDDDADICNSHPSELSVTPPRVGEPSQRHARRPCRKVAASAPATKMVAVQQHSVLHYLEASGTVRQLHTTKHQRCSSRKTTATTTPSIGRHTASEDCSPQPSPIDVGRWERDVRLRISYRMCHQSHATSTAAPTAADAPIQFALIVYEHTTRNPRTRRNLMADFGRTADVEADAEPSVLEAVDESPVVAVVDGKPKKSTSRTTSLKRAATTVVSSSKTPAIGRSATNHNKAASSLKRLRF